MSELSKIEVLEPLTVSEESERLRLERKVEKAFYEAGLALQTLRDQRLYRSTHATFEEYCQDRFNYSRSYSSRLIKAVEIVDNIKENVANWQQNKTLVLPTKESQCRPIARLKQPSSQVQAWSEAVNRSNGGNPTTKIVEQVVNEIKPKKIVKTKKKNQLKIEYAPLKMAEIGQSVRVSSHHPLYSLRAGRIAQLPNNQSAIVELDNQNTELIDIKDLETQIPVARNNHSTNSTTPVEGPNRIPGMGLEWYVKVDEETFLALQKIKEEDGAPTIGAVVKRLLSNR